MASADSIHTVLFQYLDPTTGKHLRRGAACLLFLLLPLTVRAAATLSPPERVMAQTVDNETQQALDLLRKLVVINSGTMNLEGVKAVGRLLQPEFASLGFNVKWIPMEEVHRAGTLVAEHPCPQAGMCGKRLLLIGHMDTVFERESTFQKYAVNGNIAVGPGTSDMKGGLVVMIYALRAMQQAGVLDHSAITVVLSGDEEQVGSPAETARKDMIDAAKHSDVALEFENTANVNGRDYGSISRRSSTTWRLETRGETGHTSGIFSTAKGYGAIYELARILDAFRQQLPEPSLTYSVGFVLGGSTARLDPGESSGTAEGKSNIIPPLALALGDIRTLSNEQTKRVESKMRRIVEAHLPKTQATIKFSEGYPAMPPTAGNRGLLALLNGVNASLDQPPMPELDPLNRGAGDVAFVAPFVDALAGVGSTGEGAHAPGESINLARQPLQTKRAAILMYRLSRLDRSTKLAELTTGDNDGK
jgi:glutamate carboxypeptidase